MGFAEASYEMEAGELKEVCVEAVGKLQKSVSVALTVRETSGKYMYILFIECMGCNS